MPWACGGSQARAEDGPERGAGTVSGAVFHDANRNGLRDPEEKGLPDVRVSNGREVLPTDSKGRFRLPIDDETIIFVIKPSGWMTPLNAQNLPRFYQVHKPEGSPHLEYPGVAPTGPLPDSVDFPLVPHPEPERFRTIFFGDTQPQAIKEVDYLAHDVVEELIGADALFGVTLGDMVGDSLSLYDQLTRTVGMIGVPWYHVLGNHDMNQDAPDDRRSDETFERVFGPSYYAFDYGPVHFVVLDDVIWTGPIGETKGRYDGGLGPRQLEFVRNDLAGVPEERLVVLMMHIPLLEVNDREALFRLLESRPHTLSVSAHWHIQRHCFLGPTEGWQGPRPHHHLINVTACGSWWRGAPDEVGLPHATMRDGAPNGYSIITFDGNQYAIEFKAARRPTGYQMNIFAPDEVAAAEAGETEVLVNVFAGSERSTVELRLGETAPWTRLERIEREDPYYLAMKRAEEDAALAPGRKMREAVKSPHLWRALLPAQPPPGTHLIHVRTTDMFGHTYTDQRVIRIR
ncbi:MAG: calcineurin-like phosphoesterase family protein [Planctomycetota bacterium]